MLKIDVDAIVRARAPRYYKWLPKFLIRRLERFIRQERLNELLVVTDGLTGQPFCDKLLDELQVTYAFENVPPLKAERPNAVTYACNHPLGALDGIALIDFITKLHGVEPAFVVNDLLSVLSPLDGVFIPINKHGAQSRGAVSDVDAAFKDLDRPVVMFPAGMCSRRGKGGEIKDLKWNKMFVTKSAESGRDIIPLHCYSRNSDFFYKFAQWRERLGMKFNLEMICLPKEFVEPQQQELIFHAGEPIPASTLPRGGAAAVRLAAEIRDLVYTL